MGFFTDMGQPRSGGDDECPQPNEVQFEKAMEPMLVKAVGRVSLTRAEQPLKVPSSILESAAGRVSLTRRLQKVKADRPIFASVTTEKSTLVREEQLKNARRPMVVR